jgi:hypothetical protein
LHEYGRYFQAMSRLRRKEELLLCQVINTAKQERKADHIAEGYEEKGVSKKEAEARAWATVNKQDGGGKNPGGSGRKGAKKKDD